MRPVVDPKRVLVTGVGGFIGGFLACDLAKRGYKVVGTARSMLGLPRPVLNACHEIFEVTIDGATDWLALHQGVRCVVHAAAHVHVARPSRRDQWLFRQVNVEGTRRLAEACRQNKVEVLINLSSIFARAKTLDSELSGYGRSKAEAEQAIEILFADGSCRHVSLRLPPVYGPGCKGGLGLLFWLLGTGLPLPLVVGSAKRSYLSIWNLADCVAHCLLEMPRSNCTVAIADPAALDLEELVLTISRALGKRQRLVRIDRSLLAMGARIIGLGPQFERGLSADVVDLAEAIAALGWRPALSAAECWSRVVTARLSV